MKRVISYTACPGCGADTIYKVLTAEDHTLSHETFNIWECSRCTLRFTQDIPSENDIGAYYQSAGYISHSDTQTGLVNRLYHIVRRMALNSKRKLIESAVAGNTRALLDIGAGTGAFAHHMKQHGWMVTGLEPDAGARKKAVELYHLNLLPTDELWQLPSGSMDVITMWHVLEHVHRLHDYLQQLKALLKPGGLLLIAVPNYTSRDAAVYHSCWAAYDVPRHLYHFSPASMKLLLEKHGLKQEGIRPMWFDSFYVSMLSEKCSTGSESLVKGAWTGLRSNWTALRKKDRCSSLIYIVRKSY